LSINEKSKISIGLPVYNGEKFIEKRLESILSQSYTNFELIISDNRSTDLTYEICKEYEKKDQRIRLIRQQNNIQAILNFNFVLNEAKNDYFVWASVDDLWDRTFLEKNIKYLENNNECVCSISKVEKYGEDNHDFEISKKDNLITKKYKKMRNYFRPFEIFSLDGNYVQRAKKFLDNPSALIFYGIYRTKDLKRSIIDKPILALDWIIILNVLEFGYINVLNETLFKYNTKGASSRGLINQFKKDLIPLSDLIFPYYSFFNYSLKKFGVSFVISNFRRFFTLYLGGIISNIKEVFMTNK